MGFVGHAVDDDQSKSADPVDDGGPFVHACYCGRWGCFGYKVCAASFGRRRSRFGFSLTAAGQVHR